MGKYNILVRRESLEPGSSVTNRTILDKLLKLSEPKFSHLKYGDSDTTSERSVKMK